MSSQTEAVRVTLARRLVAEGLGSLLLAATVVGSGVMADRLGAGSALGLLCNAGATVAVLVVLIALLAPVSGAHFNPAVSFVAALNRRMTWPDLSAYVLTQIVGCMAGAVLAHAMFELPLVQQSTHARTGMAQWLAELVATGGLVLIVLGHRRPTEAPWMVAAWIGAAYWFTASTSFANPAITVARALTDTFSGIRPVDVLPFIAAQLLGAVAAFVLARWLFPHARSGAQQATELQADTPA